MDPLKRASTPTSILASSLFTGTETKSSAAGSASASPPMAAPPPPPPKTEPSSPASNYFAAVRRNAPTRIKPEPMENRHPTDDGSITDVDDDDDENHKPHPADFIVKQEDRKDEARPGRAVGARRGVKRPSLPGPVSGMALSLRGKHRRRLNAILQTSVREHRWSEAAGALSMLLTGIPNLVINASEDELRRYYTVAMELHRRSGGGGDRRYENWIRRIYDTWMARLSQSRDNSRKKNSILMELSLFYFTQGNVDEACNMMECVIHDDKLANEPYVNLLYGMILYQLWYSGLPEEYKIKGFDNCTSIGTFGAASDDGCRETEIGGSANNHYAAVTGHSSQCASESSYGNHKVYMDCENDSPKTKFGVASPPQEFYGSHSTDKNEQKFGSYYPDDNLRNTSIFFARGLDTSLLPIRLDHLTGDIQQIICRYRGLADGCYADALKHLRLALHSIQPTYAALLPLVQLLLLGDQVEEAFKELENSCHSIDTALPFRLMARLLECFQSHKVAQICSYYENALKRDPICYQSLERLLKMHKSGNYSTMMMFEMIALHLDAADGQCSIWEEFASCFLQLHAAAQSEYEDRTSENIPIGRTKTVTGSKIPIALKEANAIATWKLRFAWWKRRHFSNLSLQEQAGDRKALCFKAACASHLYGPTYEYVVRVFKSLREGGDNHFSILNTHMQKAVNLFEHL